MKRQTDIKTKIDIDRWKDKQILRLKIDRYKNIIWNSVLDIDFNIAENAKDTHHLFEIFSSYAG